jgi:hypothetical protein
VTLTEDTALQPATPPEAAPPDTAERWRVLLLWVLLTGLVGTSVELLLLGHYEDRWQLAPLVVAGAAIAVFGWYGLSSSRRPVQCIRALSVLTVASAVAGIVLHYQANLEWELEVTPDLSGLPLFREVITGALPLLAPGAMAQLGLLGLLWSYRHPRLTADIRLHPPSTEH